MQRSIGRRLRAAAMAVVAVTAMAAVTATAGVAGPAAADEPPPWVGTFSALSYNVAGLPEVLSGSTPSVNTIQISPKLNAYDLVLVQEDWANPDPPVPGVEVYHEILISQVTHPYLSTPAPVPLGSNILRPSALVSDGLNRISRFPFGALTRQMWPNCFGGADTSDGGAGDCLSEKGFSVARTTFAPGVEVDVYNLHAEAGGSALDDQYRAEDYAVLAEFIAAYSGDGPVIVGGDHNLHTDEAVDGAVYETFLEATGLTDVCEVVDCGADADRIDKFSFRSGPGLTIEALTHRFERDVFQDAHGEPLSDHDALAVDFRWTMEPRFSDVGHGHPAFVDVQWAAGRGIANGYPDGRFRPDTHITRQSAAALVHRMVEGGEPAEACTAAPFPDVPVTHPFCGEIAWMAAEGYAAGYRDGTFRPTATVSRQAFSAFLHRVADPGHATAACSEAVTVDVPAAHPFCPAIAYVWDLTMPPGVDPAPPFQPTAGVTRGVAVQWIHAAVVDAEWIWD